jgi:hypothetical protein
MIARAPAIKSHPGGLYMRKAYVSFTYWLPFTSSRTGGGAAGFAGGGGAAGAGAVTLAVGFATDGLGHFEAGTASAVFAPFGGVEAAELVVAGALAAGTLAEFAGAAADPDGVTDLLEVGAVAAAGLLAVGAEAAEGAELATGAEALAVSFFVVFAGSAGGEELPAVSGDTGALLALAAGAGVTTASVLADFGGVTGRSAAGSDFFSLAVLDGASDMVMVAT